MSEVVTVLSSELISQLNDEKLVILGTIDAETGGPVANAISWVYAPNERTMRFAVDGRSRIAGNVRANPRVNATLFAAGSVHTVYGAAKIVKDALEGVPFALVCIDIEVESVRDSMFYGARISVEPAYEKTYDKRAAEKLDNQVFAAMKKA
ncbi:pyridoxamine 5'-phosphate oxidase family protein [Paenibacillus sp.]|uniref:pyridoxamine 5'-phosphate oxidase family protein n=1 Tax=Paenibacillus sp. TaxID=58172 RepID=UPI002D2E7D79|nr:pyridoxamine 5'-phosphate oxidase family protein [Paenibacillus sp.]HZG55891.1 pyridoxamine 5'-phosphate oxidase family protein [Paenibacillus sp.]